MARRTRPVIKTLSADSAALSYAKDEGPLAEVKKEFYEDPLSEQSLECQDLRVSFSYYSHLHDTAFRDTHRITYTIMLIKVLH